MVIKCLSYVTYHIQGKKSPGPLSCWRGLFLMLVRDITGHSRGGHIKGPQRKLMSHLTLFPCTVVYSRCYLPNPFMAICLQACRFLLTHLLAEEYVPLLGKQCSKQTMRVNWGLKALFALTSPRFLFPSKAHTPENRMGRNRSSPARQLGASSQQLLMGVAGHQHALVTFNTIPN